MTENDARDELRVLASATTEPVLSDDDLTVLVRGSRRVDAAGRVVSDPAWAPTYDLNWAAREAWALKGSRVEFDFTADGATFNRSQVADRCAERVAFYNRKLATTWAV